MKYNPNEIEAKWQKYWAENQTFAAAEPSTTNHQPKYYVLDMFPYPSGAGLHVGHPLGYIASDIVARYKRHQGFNVLHPQGYDSFGLPAEQYAIQTGQHPEKTTRENIARYREQLDKIGFSFDWNREVRTSNPDYYKHTQWIFIQLFNSWYNLDTDKAENITTLISIFENEGNANINAVCDDHISLFSAEDWKAFSEEEQQKILLKYRLTYLAEAEVNWCPALGTVLANDEIVNGVSERGGHPVVRKKMTQWMMRISAYAERLLQGLETIDWSESIKESQRNWIGKSVGAMVTFNVKPTTINQQPATIDVFTTRPDTIFGVTFMTLAPEHELVAQITTPEQKAAVENYIEITSKRSERERMADVKTISGVFTGAYAEHPFTKEPIPIWIGDYVLASYGTGAVMAVPCGDERDFAFANFFKGQNGMPEIKNIFKVDTLHLEGLGEEKAYTAKEGFILKNSDFLNGLGYKEATKKVIEALEDIDAGKAKVNYRLRDAVFSRQRYWGEPIPIYYKNGIPYPIPTECLPLELPEVEKYLPTEDGQPPLGNAKEWYWSPPTPEGGARIVSKEVWESSPFGGGGGLELNTMPGWAGSSWYWMRYMDAHNENEIASKEALDYWENVDLYIGGSEHATGHLLYSRFWNKFLKDMGYAPTEEPFKKLINQGMILGVGAYYPYHIFSIVFNIFNNKKEVVGTAPYDIFIFSPIKDTLSNDWFDNLFPNKIIYDIKEISNQILPNFKKILSIQLNNNTIENITDECFKIEVVEERYNNEPKRIPYNCIDPITLEINVEKLRLEPIFMLSAKIGNEKLFAKTEIGKMSKSWLNVVNPDDICEEYGADTLRLYEMFLGPLEQAKPWNTAGITGVFGFLKKLWKLYHSGENDTFYVSDSPPSEGLGEALKSLHKTIKKVTEDIENFSFNTSVSQFMICVNELTQLKCNHRAILEPLAILVSPYAPHMAEELWLGLKNLKIEELKDYEGISKQPFPIFEEKYLVESEKEYPVSFNGKMRFTLKLPLDLSKEQIQEKVMADERTITQLAGNTPKNVIIVPGKIINIVG